MVGYKVKSQQGLRRLIPPRAKAAGTGRAFLGDHERQITSGSHRHMTISKTAAPTEELPKDVAELASAVANLPAEYRSRLETLMFRVVDSTKRRRRILNLVQEALSQLRLDMKYLVFDLEATRRERDAMRQGPEDEHPRGEN
jgi:hypothetical protein